MSNRGIDLITRYCELKSNKHSMQTRRDRYIEESSKLKYDIEKIDDKLSKLKAKAPELFEQLEKEYE